MEQTAITLTKKISMLTFTNKDSFKLLGMKFILFMNLVITVGWYLN